MALDQIPNNVQARRLGVFRLLGPSHPASSLEGSESHYFGQNAIMVHGDSSIRVQDPCFGSVKTPRHPVHVSLVTTRFLTR